MTSYLDPVTLELVEWDSPISTEVPPPAAKEHKARIFRNEQWQYVSDYRGIEAYSQNDPSEMLIATHLGELPSGYTIEPPPSPFAEWVHDRWVDNSSTALDKGKAFAREAIDTAAFDVLHRYSKFEQEYLVREEQARAYAADTSTPAGSFVTSVATNLAVSLAEATQIIIAEADFCRIALDNLQQARMRKLLLQKANTQAQIKEIKDTTIDMIVQIGGQLS